MTRAEYTSLPLTLLILLVAFGALVAAGLPVLLAFSAVLAAIGLNALVSHVIARRPTRRCRVILHGRHGGRRRLLALLPPAASARSGARASRRTTRCCAPRATSGQAVLDLGRDGADRDGRDALRGQHDLHDDRRRDDDRRPLRVARLAQRAAGAAAQARRPRRPGPRPVLRTERRGRVSLLERRRRPVLRRPVISVVLVGRAARSRSRCPRSRCTRSCRASPTSRKDLPIVQTYKDVQRAFPGSQTPAELVVRGDERHDAAGSAERTRQFRERARRDGRVLPAVPRLRQPRQDGRARRVLDRRQGRRQGVEPCACDAAKRRDPADRRQAARTPTGRSPAPPPARTTSTSR